MLFYFQAEDVIRAIGVTGVQTCALPIYTPGRPDPISRLVVIEDRTTSLRRTADDTDPTERVVVANADQLVIVTAVADPDPALGFLDRCVVAAYAGGLEPLLCLTKTDLGSPQPLLDRYAGLEVDAVPMSQEAPLAPLLDRKSVV